MVTDVKLKLKEHQSGFSLRSLRKSFCDLPIDLHSITPETGRTLQLPDTI